MVFLPKKPSGQREGVDYYTPDDTRPLAIVNTDNRLIANAVRHRMEGILGEIISEGQRGFLPGRSLLANVVDIEHAMQVGSVSDEDPAAIFFDFKAAFPSISHDFIAISLKELGLPSFLCNYINSLYYDNESWVTVGNRRFGKFPVAAGIRQGCPPPLSINLRLGLRHVASEIRPLLPTCGHQGVRWRHCSG